MSWITHILPKIKREDDNERKPSPIPEGVWTKCPGCEQPLYTEELRAKHSVFSERSRMARMVVLRFYQYESDKQYLA